MSSAPRARIRRVARLSLAVLASGTLARCGGDGPGPDPSNPVIELTPAAVQFAASVGAGSPDAQTVSVTNAGTGKLEGLTTAISYGSGGATGWLSASLSSPVAPSTLGLSVATGALAAGTYSATVAVSSSAATNSPQAVAVTLVIAGPPAPPAGPTNLVATAISTSRIDLAWTDNAGNELGFRIERCTGAGCTGFAEIATVAPNVTSYHSTGLDASTSYRYRVRAFGLTQGSAYSNTAEAMTLASE